MKVLFCKKSKNFMCSLLIMITMVCLSTIEVRAVEILPEIECLEMVSLDEADININTSPNIKALLHNCLISVNSSSNGMRVTFMTQCSQNASTIGVKNVEIKQRVWYGWKTVATSSGGYNTNEQAYMGTILYTNAIKGEEYRITCTHYADADEYTEVHGELDVVFTY